MFDLAALPAGLEEIRDTMEVSSAALSGRPVRRQRTSLQKKSPRQRVFRPSWRSGAAPGPSGTRNAR
eukprot:2376314-Prorocentrum_lima.AAC.1